MPTSPVDTRRINMEQRLYFRLQSCLDHLLRNAIGHRRNAQLSFATVFLWYLHRPDRWRKVAARRHPIPDLVKILLQPLFKIFDRLIVDPCSSFILLHPLVRFPNLLLRNTKRLCLIHRAPPIAGWLIEFGSLTQRLRSIPLSETSSLLRAVPPLSLRFRTLALVVLPLVASPFASESQVPTFRSTASLASSGHLSCRMPLRP